MTAVPHNAAVNVSWSPPDDTGEEPVLSYNVSWWSNGMAPSSVTVANRSTHAWIGSLVNGVDYSFAVAASNGLGTGNFSPPVDARPGTVPSVPEAPSVVAGNGSIEVSWSAPATTPGYPILDYLVRVESNGSGFNVTVNGSVTGWSGVGLVNGLTYRVALRAENAFGPGPFSPAATAEPVGLPSAPRALSARWVSAFDRYALSWSPPVYEGGVPLANYTLSWTVSGGGGHSVHVAPGAASYLLPTLPAGTTVSLLLFASNRAGDGPATHLFLRTPVLPAPPPLLNAFTSPVGIALVFAAASITTVALLSWAHRRNAFGPRGG